MLSHCLRRKNAESKTTKTVKTKHGRIMILSNCAVCVSKKTKFIKEQETSELLSKLGIRIPLS